MDWHIAAAFLGGFVLLVVGAEMLVRGATRLAFGIGITPLVVGLTVVAYGTSSPELAVSVSAALNGQADISLGNVVGSNIANILLVLGISAWAAPLAISPSALRLSVPVMIAVSLLLLVMAADGAISRIEGLLLLAGAAAFTGYTLFLSRGKAIVDSPEETLSVDGVPMRRLWILSVVLDLALIAGGLAALMWGADFLVESAVSLSRRLGVSELIIGLTIVAVGTSLPEIATSIVASLRGQRDIAVGNAVGSNIFNILLVLGTAAAMSPGGVPVSPAALWLDIPVMIAVALVCVPVFITGQQLSRWEGIMFVGYYTAYLVYLCLAATQHHARAAYSWIMLSIIIPLTLLTLLLTTLRSLRTDQMEQ